MGRKRGVHTWEFGVNDFAHSVFVGGIQVGEQEAYGQSFDTIVFQAVQCLVQRVFVQVDLDAAIGAHPLRNLSAHVSRNQWLNRGHPQIVAVFF